MKQILFYGFMYNFHKFFTKEKIKHVGCTHEFNREKHKFCSRCGNVAYIMSIANINKLTKEKVCNIQLYIEKIYPKYTVIESIPTDNNTYFVGKIIMNIDDKNMLPVYTYLPERDEDLNKIASENCTTPKLWILWTV